MSNRGINITFRANNFLIKRDIKKRIRQTLEKVFRNILTVKADCNFAYTVLYLVRKTVPSEIH